MQSNKNNAENLSFEQQVALLIKKAHENSKRIQQMHDTMMSRPAIPRIPAAAPLIIFEGYESTWLCHAN